MLKKIAAGLVLYAVAFGGSNLTGMGGGTFSPTNVSNDKPSAIPAAKLGADPKAPRPLNDNVIAYSTEDEAMNAAKAQGRKTLPRFERMWDEQAPGTFSIKFPLTQNGETEHIWLQIDGIKDGKFAGRLANVPVNGNQYKMGQRMTVAKSDVEDWMIRDGDGIWGAYSARVMLAAMPKDQAAALQAMLRD